MARARSGSLDDGAIWLAVYVVAVLLVLLPLGDLASNAWPFRVGEIQWQYGFLGLLGNVLLTPLLGATLALVAALRLEHRRVLTLQGVLYALGSVALLLGVGLFALNVVQLRPSVNPQNTIGYEAGAVYTAVKYVCCAVAFALLARGAFKARKGMGRPSRKKGQPSLVVGSEPG